MSKKHKGQCFRIDGKEYPIVCEFPIMRIGWESDNIGYVVQDGDKRKFATTNHGRPCWMTPEEVGSYIFELQSVLYKTQDAASKYMEMNG